MPETISDECCCKLGNPTRLQRVGSSIEDDGETLKDLFMRKVYETKLEELKTSHKAPEDPVEEPEPCLRTSIITAPSNFKSSCWGGGSC